jgi:hypothetical protein
LYSRARAWLYISLARSKVQHVTESLAQLIARRIAEISRQRGGATVTLHELWESLPEDPAGRRAISYELVRRVANGDHTNIKDPSVDAIAAMLGVPTDDVLAAAGMRVRLGPFKLPRRADRLDSRERKVVLGVVEAILNAHETKEGTEHGDSSAEKTELEAARSRRGQNLSAPDETVPKVALETDRQIDQPPGDIEEQ